MAVGDTNDNLTRLLSALPPWFPTNLADRPVLTALLTGVADAFAFVYSYLSFAALQTRIGTASGGWLDLIGWDFFGSRFTRRFGESDSSWQPRILMEILRPRQTRAAIIQMLKDLTSRTPILFEFWNPGDCGGYRTGYPLGYSAAGCYGSLQYNDQIFITAFRAPTQGIPSVAGYGSYYGGYRTGISEYGSLAFVTGPITDTEIYARIQQTIAAGTTAWVALENTVPITPTQRSAIMTNAKNSQYIAII